MHLPPDDARHDAARLLHGNAGLSDERAASAFTHGSPRLQARDAAALAGMGASA
ncbi:hypothetical protein [Pseudorhodoferax aquiterrae]|uniref:hypothetical protein n=1 Tax=Pseudorhodoferax aquiterrae TaxID=747304 RepID=UPI0016722F7F|nr:hypothetical protein [Pseudorhodoferax aquiterrae]